MGGLNDNNVNVFTGGQQQNQNQNLIQTMAFGSTGTFMKSPPPQEKKEKQQEKPFFPSTTSTSASATGPSTMDGAGASASLPSSQATGGTDWLAQMQHLLAEQKKLQQQQQMNSGSVKSAPTNNAAETNLALTSPARQPGASAANVSTGDQSMDFMNANASNVSNIPGMQLGAGSASAVSASVMQAMMAAAAASHPNSMAATPSSAMTTPWASTPGQQSMVSSTAPAMSQSGGMQGLLADQELKKLLKVGQPGGVSEEVARAIFSSRNASVGAGAGLGLGLGGYGSAMKATGVTVKDQKKKRGRPSKSSVPSQASNATSTSAPSTSTSVPVAAKPPVLTQRQKHRLLVKKVLQANPSLVLAASPPPIESLSGADHLIASTVPSSFPPDLVFRALSSYATLRSLSTQLKTSPFTPQAFLRALALPVPTKLLGEVHTQLLHLLYEVRGFGLYAARGDGIRASNNRGDCDGVRRMTAHEHGGENLANLDGWTWPLFYDDYCSLVEDDFLDSANSDLSMVDMRSHCMQSIQGLSKLDFISDLSDFRYGMVMDESGAFIPSANPSVSQIPPSETAMNGAKDGTMDLASGRGARRKARPQASMDESDTSSHSSASSRPQSDEESSDDEYKPFWQGGGRGRGRGG